MSIIKQFGEVGVTEKPSGVGCVSAMLGINAILIGLLALSFSHRPYSSHEQELWYRYGSLGFLLVGVIIPGAAFWFGALRSQRAIVGLFIWMIATLIACLIYALLSGGGV